MRTKIRSRLDHYTVHCPTCGRVPHGSIVEGRPDGVHDDETSGHRPSFGIVPVDRWESWAVDLEIDREFENEIH